MLKGSLFDFLQALLYRYIGSVSAFRLSISDYVYQIGLKFSISTPLVLYGYIGEVIVRLLYVSC